MLPAVRTFTLTLIAVLFIATSLSVVAAPARTLPVHTAYDAPNAPPNEPIYEIEPSEREGYTWCSGYWQWNGEKYTWRPGYWVKDRPGYIWTSESWAKRGEKWRLNPGHWEKLAPENSTTKEEAEQAEENEEAAPADDAAPVATNGKATTKTATKVRKKRIIHKNYAPAHPTRR